MSSDTSIFFFSSFSSGLPWVPGLPGGSQERLFNMNLIGDPATLPPAMRNGKPIPPAPPLFYPIQPLHWKLKQRTPDEWLSHWLSSLSSASSFWATNSASEVVLFPIVWPDNLCSLFQFSCSWSASFKDCNSRCKHSTTLKNNVKAYMAYPLIEQACKSLPLRNHHFEIAPKDTPSSGVPALSIYHTIL